MAKHYGRCALCGQESELTFEHIPPRKAFNWFPQRTISGDTWLDSFSDPLRKPWDVEDLHYNNQQRGIGLYSLCQKCNNFTGARYGNEYVRFTHGLHALMEKEQTKPGMTMFLESAQFRPLPVMKQIISMFCSMHQRMHDRSDMELLRKFVLDENSTDFPKDKFRLGMYLFHGGVMRRCPITVMGMTGESEIRFDVISELVTYPVGYMLYFGPSSSTNMPCSDITDFCDFQYDQEVTIQIQLPIYECNSMVIGDFRSKDEIEAKMNENTDESELYDEYHL